MSDEDEEEILLIIKNIPSKSPKVSMRPVNYKADYFSLFGECNRSSKDKKWKIVLSIAGLLADPTVLIEGVLFRARYLGSTQLACEGQPTKSTRMCQAEEAVSRIKV